MIKKEKDEINNSYLKKLNSILLTINNIHKILLKTKDSHSFINKVCKIIDDSDIYENALIVLFDKKQKPIDYAISESLNNKREIIKEMIDKKLPECIKQFKKKDEKFIRIFNERDMCKNCPLLSKDKRINTFLSKIRYKNTFYGILKINIKEKNLLIKNDNYYEEKIFIELSENIGFFLHNIEKEKEKEILEKKYLKLFRTSPDCVYFSNVEGRFLEVNDACVRMLGYHSKEEVLRIDMIRDLYVDAANREAFKETIMKHGYTKDFRLTLKKRNGEIIYLEDSSVIIKDENEKIIGFQGIMKDITERLRYQREIMEREKRLKDIIESTNDWIWEIDKKGRYVYCSEKVMDILGYTREEVIGKTPFDFMLGTEKERVKQLFIKLKTNKKPIVNLENWAIRKNGKKICLLTNGVPVFDERGELLGYRGADKDITDLKQAEEEIIKNEKKFRNIFNSLIDIYYQADIKGIITLISPSVEKITGYKPEELIGKHVSTVYKEKTERNQFFNKLVLKKEIKDYEIKLIRKNGEIAIASINAHLIIDKGGKPIAIKGMIRDITERVKEEEKLRILALAIEHLDSAFVITDTKGVIEYVNPAYEKITGYTKEEVIGKNQSILKSGKHKENFYKNLWLTISSGKVWRDIFINKKKDGTIYYEGGTVFPVFNNKGKILHYAAVKRDITEKLKNQEEIYYKNKALEETNKKLKETQSQLIQQEKLASIGTLAAGIAHELNNPIGFIASNLNTLKKYNKSVSDFIRKMEEELEKKENNCSEITAIISKYKKENHIDFLLEDVGDLVNESLEGVERITSIVKNLRSFSRIDQMGEIKEYDIREGIKSTLIIAKNNYKYVAEVKTEFEEVPSIKCMPNEINQVFLNIIVNAAQAIESEKRKEKGLILIKVYEEKDFVCCSIYDDGPKIPEEVINKIFDPFFTTKEAGKGTGLGLNISYDIIVNKHKGELLAENCSEKGVEFIIKLPKNNNGGNEDEK
jgi:PAS domain S-box-containing protein